MQKGFSRIAVTGIVAAVVVIVIMFGYSITPKKSTEDTKTGAVSETIQEEATFVTSGASTTPVVNDPSIKVLSPTKNQNLQIGSSYVIRWSNYSGSEKLNIGLQTIKPDGQIETKIIASNISNAGVYNWVVTSEKTEYSYRIEIYPSGGRELVGRSETFSITDTAPFIESASIEKTTGTKNGYPLGKIVLTGRNFSDNDAVFIRISETAGVNVFPNGDDQIKMVSPDNKRLEISPVSLFMFTAKSYPVQIMSGPDINGSPDVYESNRATLIVLP